MLLVVALSALGYILLLPVSNNVVLYPVFVVLGLVATVVVVFDARRLPGPLVALSLLMFGLGAYGSLLAVINGNDGLLFALLVSFAAPTLFLLCAWATTLDAARWFLRIAAVATITISVVILLYVGGEANVIGQWIPGRIVEFLDLQATFRDGSSQARSYNLSSLAALGPLWAASLVVRRDDLLPHWSVRAMCAVLAAAASFISGRDAIVLVIVIAPFLAIVVRFALGVARQPWRLSVNRAAIGTSLAALASIIAIPFAPAVLDAVLGPVGRAARSVASFLSGATSTTTEEQNIRVQQAAALLEAWAQNPVFGYGFGASVPGYDRVSERPWALELRYHVLLFSVGLIGVLFLAAIAVCCIVAMRAAARRMPHLLSTITVSCVAAIAMLFANATNPYLQAPGHFWAIFLPLGIAVAVLGNPPGTRTAELAVRDASPMIDAPASAHPSAATSQRMGG